MQLNKMKKSLKKIITNNFVVTFLGLVIFFISLWFRFLRPKVEKAIPLPLNLTICSASIIMILCLVYIYHLYFLIIRKEKKQIINIQEYLFKLIHLLTILDNTVKEIKKFNILITKFFMNIIIYFKLYLPENNLYFYLILNFIPRLILLIIFIFDICYSKCISNFYNFLFLGLIVLFYNYFIYTIKKDFELIKQFLDLNCYIKIISSSDDSKNYFVDPCMLVSKDDDSFFDTHYFLNTQATGLIWGNDLYDFVFIETYKAREDYVNKKNIKDAQIHIMVENFDEVSKKLSKHFYIEAEKAIYYLAFLKIKEEFIQESIRKLNIIILIGYLICWVYILIISFHTIESL